MQRFISEQNILSFKARLAGETDVHKRGSLQRLIAEEEAKLASILGGAPTGGRLN